MLELEQEEHPDRQCDREDDEAGVLNVLQLALPAGDWDTPDQLMI